MKNILLLLLFIPIPGYGQQLQPANAANDEIYTIFNAYFSTEDRFDDVKSITGDEAYTPLIEADTLALSEMDTLFTKEDIAYLCLQAKDTVPFKIQRDKTTMFPEIDLIVQTDISSVYADLKEKFEVVFATSLSKPLFSKDHSVAILYISINDFDRKALPGQSRHIYSKQGGTWKLVSIAVFELM